MKNFFKAICRGIVKGAIIAYCKIVYRMKVVGKENIPQKGPIIICGNHRIFLDPPLIEVTCGRYSRFLAKEELTKNNALYVADISGMPSLISKFIALPKMKKYPFSVMLLDDTNKDFFGKEEGKIIVYSLDNLKITEMKSISTAKELEEIIK